MADVERVDHIRVPATGTEAANRFYGELLGLKHGPDGNVVIVHRRYVPRVARSES